MNDSMFYIKLYSVVEAVDFVSITNKSSKVIHITNGTIVANAKSLLGVMSLVRSKPNHLTVIYPNGDGKRDMDIVNQIKSKYEVH